MHAVAVIPPAPVTEVREEAAALRVEVRPRPFLWARLVPFWLLAWIGGGIYAVSRTTDHPAFLAVWIPLWIASACVLAYAYAWTFFGREVLVADGRRVEIRRDVLWVRRTRELPASEVTAVTAEPLDLEALGIRVNLLVLGICGAAITLEARKGKHRFGQLLAEDEAARIAATLTDALALDA